MMMDGDGGSDPLAGDEDPSLRLVEAILEDLLPHKSKAAYDKAWKNFHNHCRIKKGEKPSEAHFMGYFDYLSREKKLKTSTMWSTFSMLNQCNQIEFGDRLQDAFPCLKVQLKQYNSGYVRKVAKVFTNFELNDFMAKTHEGPKRFWQLRKAAVALSFTGGLRTTELKNLKFKNLSDSPAGVWVDYTPAKQRGEVKTSRFLVPVNPESPGTCYASHLRAYLSAVNKSLGNKVDTDLVLFLKCLKGGGFSKVPMGINRLYKIPGEVAAQLKLEDPTKYTGHSFRRSSATQMANTGATSTDLRRFYHWKNDSTANQYIDKSATHGERIGNMIAGVDVPFAEAAAQGAIMVRHASQVTTAAPSAMGSGGRTDVATALSSVMVTAAGNQTKFFHITL
jgi:integrase